MSVQGDVEARTAVRTSAELYSALAAGEPVTSPWPGCTGRCGGALRTGDWALPTVTVRGGPEQVLESGVLAARRDGGC